MSEAAVRVVLTSSVSGSYTGGVTEFEVEAHTLRGVLKALDERFPGLGQHLEDETTIAIDGEIHEVDYSQPVRPGCDVFFIPRIEGG